MIMLLCPITFGPCTVHPWLCVSLCSSTCSDRMSHHYLLKHTMPTFFPADLAGLLQTSLGIIFLNRWPEHNGNTFESQTNYSARFFDLQLPSQWTNVLYIITSVINTLWKQLHHPWGLLRNGYHLQAPLPCTSCLSLKSDSGGGVSVWRQTLTKRTRRWLMVARPARDTGTPLKANMCHSSYCVRAPLLFLSPSPSCLHFS